MKKKEMKILTYLFNSEVRNYFSSPFIYELKIGNVIGQQCEEIVIEVWYVKCSAELEKTPIFRGLGIS